MSTLGTFDSFTAMRLGIYAAQQGLRVTGNNISNINTVGYTRQRVDQVSFKTGGSDRYSSMIDKKVGNGVLISGINQIRDPYLDIRYRNASNDTYHLDTWLAGLQDIRSILDEVGKGENDGDGLIYAQLQDLAEKLRSYSANPTIENDRLVRESANALTALFRNSADRLDKLYADTKTDFYKNVDEVNKILYNIRDLDKSIREAEIHGDMALELRDERNLQIDKLSQFLDIKVEYSYEDVGAGIQVEKLTIKLNNANPDKDVTTDESILVDGVYATQLSVPEKMPLLNAFADGEKYAYLKDAPYLRELKEDEIDQFLKDNGLTSRDQLFSMKDANGNTVYYAGTDKVDDAAQVDNEKLIIHLDKLLNSKGDEWENNITTWTGVADATNIAATYKYTIDIADSALGRDDLTFTIDIDGKEKEYKIPKSKTGSKEDILAYIAGRLNASGKYSDYTVTAEDGQLVFTAKKPGSILDENDDPTIDPPDFTVKPPTGTWLEVPNVNDPDFEDGVLPDDAGTKDIDEYTSVTNIYTQVDGKWYKVSVRTERTHEVTLDDNDLHGIIQAQRELLTEEGEFSSEYDVGIDENALSKRGIIYYQKSLDLLAQRIAEEYNKLNQGYAYNQDGYYLDPDGNVLELAGEPVKHGEPLTDAQKKLLEQYENYTTDGVADVNKWLAKRGYPMGGPLFSNGNNGNDTTGINAHNIDISYDWVNGATNLVPTFKMLFTDEGKLEHSTQNDNADHMLAMIDKSLVYNPQDLLGSDAIGPMLFEGSFNDMLSHMMAMEADDARVTTIKLNTSASTLDELDYAREGVSGVDLNDEAMNMVQYQKAMNAAMRLMTAIDEALERLINNTGVAGR